MHESYSFMPGNCFKLLNDTRHLFQQNTFSGHRQSLSDVSLVFLFYSSYCNTFNSMEIYIITIIYDRWVVCTNI